MEKYSHNPSQAQNRGKTESEKDDIMRFQREESRLIEEITDVIVQKKYLEEREKVLRNRLIEAMGSNEIKTFENSVVKFFYMPSSFRNGIDSARLRKEMPEIAAKYSKVTPVSASVKISLK